MYIEKLEFLKKLFKKNYQIYCHNNCRVKKGKHSIKKSIDSLLCYDAPH